MTNFPEKWDESDDDLPVVDVVVTRHPALVEYARELGMIYEETRVISHATKEDVFGQDVLGILPLNLAVYAKSITEIPLDIPAELRGKELSLEEMKKYARSPAVYAVFSHDYSGFYSDREKFVGE